MGKKISDRFNVQVGLRQGYLRFPWLLIFIDGAVKELNGRAIDRNNGLRSRGIGYPLEVN